MNFCSDPLLGHFYNFYILMRLVGCVVPVHADRLTHPHELYLNIVN